MRLIVIGTHADELREYGAKLEEMRLRVNSLIIEHKFSFTFDPKKDVFVVGSNSLIFTRQLSDLRQHLLQEVAPNTCKDLLLTQDHQSVLETLSNLNDNFPFAFYADLEAQVASILKNKLKGLLLDLSSMGHIVFFDSEGPLSKFVIKEVKWINKVFKQMFELHTKESNKCDFLWSEIWPLVRDNTFAQFSLCQHPSQVLLFVKHLRIHFDILLPIDNLGSDSSERFLLPILLTQKTAVLTCREAFKRRKGVYSFLERVYRLKFKPAGLFQRIFVRIRGIFNRNESASKLKEKRATLSSKFGRILYETISSVQYSLQFSEWEVKVKTRISCTPHMSLDQSERDIGVQKHELTVQIFHHHENSSTKELELASGLLEVISREIERFTETWYPSLPFVQSESDHLSGWKKGHLEHKESLLDLSEYSGFDGILICENCKMEAKLKFVRQECVNCLQPLLLFKRFAVVSKVLVDSAQAKIWHSYDLQSKRHVAVKERKKHDYHLQKSSVQRQVYLYKWNL